MPHVTLIQHHQLINLCAPVHHNVQCKTHAHTHARMHAHTRKHTHTCIHTEIIIVAVTRVWCEKFNSN